ncbi:MAG: hypothetical protein Q9174_003219 [Haloplaca sp. 1 TL-2023]
MYKDYALKRDDCDIQHPGGYPPMPSLMAALAIGNEIFFSSQLRGFDTKKFIYFRGPEVRIELELDACRAYLLREGEKQVPGAQETHQNMNCAEIMAVAMYMTQHPGQAPRDYTGGEGQASARRARFAVWGNYETPFNKLASSLLSPCDGIAEVAIPKYGTRSETNQRQLPVNQIQPVQTQGKGVPLIDMDNLGGLVEPIDLNDEL